MASTASTGVETAVSGPQKLSVQQRFSGFVNFLYDPVEGTVMGRSGKSWAQIGFFYLIFYSCLIGFFVGLLAVFYKVLDETNPRLTGSDSLLKGNPGLGFRPMPDVTSTLIRFEKSDPNTFTIHTDHIESYLQYYHVDNKVEDGILVDCDSYSERRPKDEWDKACNFDTKLLGSDCIKEQTFGFEYGKPCILVKMNRLFDWIPEEFTNDTVSNSIRDQWSQFYVTVTCVGENPADKDNMGNLTYYPAHGFHYKYFPYRNQEGYRSPLVFVRFEDPTIGVLLMVTCKIHARNIYHDFLEKAGSVHFELLVD